MKIIILGPVVTPSYFGGVATFDEGLGMALANKNNEVIIATDQKDAVEKGLIKKITHGSFKKLVRDFDPDYILSELGYAKHYYFIKTAAKKVYYLHAFFKQSYYGALKSRLAVFYQKRLIRKSDIVISNSFFTSMINKDFFGIDTYDICQVGVTDYFYEQSKRYMSVQKEPNSVFFAARLVPAKGADKVLSAIKLLHRKKPEIKLYLAGDGSEKEKLVKYVEDNKLPVEFLGRLTQDQMIEQYAKMEVFVSLDPSEPYGIVYLEALISNCKIVCPYTGGQMEMLSDYGQSVSYVYQEKPESIAKGIWKALESKGYPNLTNELKQQYTYSHVADELIRILGSERK